MRGRSATARAHRAAVALLLAVVIALVDRTTVANARVLLIVVDGLDARSVSDEETPRLAEAWRTSRWCPGARSLAAMPTRTNSNHATLMTGVQPAAHGITGNAFWDRATRSTRKLGVASDFLTETIFTVARRSGTGIRTAVAVGKPKLATMFAAHAGQVAPDASWDPRTASDSAKDDGTGYAYDATTLAAVRGLIDHEGADFVFLNLADVDRVSHGFGPASPQAQETRRRTDAAVGAFLDWLAARHDWPSTTVVITADHGFDAMTTPAMHFAEVLADAGIRGLATVGDGGVGHVYLDPRRRARDPAALLAAARRVALPTPGIAEALYLEPNAADGGARYTVTTAHPDWHVEHERSGDLLLVAHVGHQIVDGFSDEGKLVGNHGGPAERAVPALALGGAPFGRGADCEHITAADLGRTVQACLGLREVQRLDGRTIAVRDRGRVLTGLCPGTVQSPRVIEP